MELERERLAKKMIKSGPAKAATVQAKAAIPSSISAQVAPDVKAAPAGKVGQCSLIR